VINLSRLSDKIIILDRPKLDVLIDILLVFLTERHKELVKELVSNSFLAVLNIIVSYLLFETILFT